MARNASHRIVALLAVAGACAVASPALASGGGGGGGGNPPASPSSCSIFPQAMPDGNVGTLNTWFVSTSGCATSNKPVRFTVIAGRIPPGLTLFTQGVSSGGITGRPTTEGTFPFTLQVQDQTGARDTEAFSITIHPPRPVVITNQSGTLAAGTRGQSYAAGLFADGGVP